MSTATIVPEQRVLLRSIAWETYETLANNSDRAGQLLTYDRGLLEIMSPSKAHESDKAVISRMIEMYSLHHDLDICSTASTTFKRSDLQRGFEADASYYIQNEAVVRAKGEIDLATDPPPDLVIEVEISRSAINKLAHFATIGIPEVWRYNGKTIWVGQLVGVSYEAIDESLVLKGFPIGEAVRILQALGTASETELIRQFVSSL